MTTREVISALISYPQGTKFSHPYFSDDEYMVNENGTFKTEEGYPIMDEFWTIRKDWTGWYVKEEVK